MHPEACGRLSGNLPAQSEPGVSTSSPDHANRDPCPAGRLGRARSAVVGVGAGYLLKRALKDFWKLLLISLPLLLPAWGLWELFGYLGQKFVADAKPPRQWLELTLTAARWLIFYLALPLWAIHLWMAAIREGLASAFKGIGRSLQAAFSPRSVLIYGLVMTVFGALAYFIGFTETHVKSEWGELWLAGIRFGLALLLPFVGWMLALGALAEMTARRAMSELEV